MGIPGDRRHARRYEIGLPLTFRTDDGVTGTGAMKDISRTGMRFATDTPMRTSSHIEITAEWPVRLRGLYPTQLKVLGIVTRVGSNEVAVMMIRHAIQPVAAVMTASSPSNL